MIICHMIVGDANNVPTEDELTEMELEFLKPIPTYTRPVKIVKLETGLDLTSRLMIQAGERDWNPTPGELATLRGKFHTARHGASVVAVATRSGVKVSLIPELPNRHSQQQESKQ